MPSFLGCVNISNCFFFLLKSKMAILGVFLTFRQRQQIFWTEIVKLCIFFYSICSATFCLNFNNTRWEESFWEPSKQKEVRMADVGIVNYRYMRTTKMGVVSVTVHKLLKEFTEIREKLGKEHLQNHKLQCYSVPDNFMADIYSFHIEC